MSPGSVLFAFSAGLISIVTPCVLPLVPGYLSAVSAVEPHRLGEPGIARRVLVSSVPFFVGFTVVFVALGAGAAALGGVLPPDRRTEVAGLIMVVFGLAFLGLLPVPDACLRRSSSTPRDAGLRLPRSSVRRLRGALRRPHPRLCARARQPLEHRRAGVAAPRRVLARASLGFLLAGIGFVRAMGAFRWLRDHYRYVQWVSGVLLVALGLMLFFHRDYWLRVMANRVLEFFGVEGF